ECQEGGREDSREAGGPDLQRQTLPRLHEVERLERDRRRGTQGCQGERAVRGEGHGELYVRGCEVRRPRSSLSSCAWRISGCPPFLGSFTSPDRVAVPPEKRSPAPLRRFSDSPQLLFPRAPTQENLPDRGRPAPLSPGLAS